MRNRFYNMQVLNSKRMNRECNMSAKSPKANLSGNNTKNCKFYVRSLKYLQVTAMESCLRTTLKMQDELFEGIFLNLCDKNSVKSFSSQKRILRRIVEKRQAQCAYNKLGRSDNRFTSHFQRYCTSKSMSDICNYQMYA